MTAKRKQTPFTACAINGIDTLYVKASWLPRDMRWCFWHDGINTYRFVGDRRDYYKAQDVLDWLEREAKDGINEHEIIGKVLKRGIDEHARGEMREQAAD